MEFLVAIMLLKFPALFFSDRAGELTVLEYSYVMALADGHKQSGKAKLFTQDTYFRLEAGQFRVVNDAVGCWIMDGSSNEAVVYNPMEVNLETSPEHMMELMGMNPRKAALDVKYDDSGLISYLSALTEDGVRLELNLRSASRKTALPEAEMVFDPASLNPKIWVITDLRD